MEALPRPENKLDAPPAAGAVVPPNNGLGAGMPEADAPPEVGGLLPRLPKSDMSMLCWLVVLIALENTKRDRVRFQGAWTTPYSRGS